MKHLSKREISKMDKFELKMINYNGTEVLVKVYECVNDNIETFKKKGGYLGMGLVR